MRFPAIGNLGAILCAAGLLAGCASEQPGDAIDSIQDDGVLRVAVRNAPTSYYIGPDEVPRGPEYDMASDFADYLGVDLEIEVEDSVTDVLAAVADGDVHLAAAGLTNTEERRKRFRFGPTYQTISQQVVCASRGQRADNVEELTQVDVAVVADSSYEERLKALKKDYPTLTWDSREITTEQLLRQVWRKKLDCTVADSNIVDINRRYFPSLLVSFNLTQPQSLAWLMQPVDERLDEALEEWFAEYEDSGELASMKERYYGFITKFDFVDKKKLLERIDSRYDKYDHLFRKAAERYGFPETLLAAQAYQESHWDPKAKSPTGVRGIMMLTKPTARELGVKNRLDPAQSIDGGARYLKRMRERLPDDITEPERTYMALAAYNVGLAHLRDARKLAQRLGKDPHVWSELRQVLPKLSDKRYYKTLKYGYARGLEPVRYVRHIRDYDDVIAKHLAAAEFPAPGNVDTFAKLLAE